MSEYHFEEITFGITTIIALLCYGLGLNVLCGIFTVKALVDFYCVYREAKKIIAKKKAENLSNQGE